MNSWYVQLRKILKEQLRKFLCNEKLQLLSQLVVLCRQSNHFIISTECNCSLPLQTCKKGWGSMCVDLALSFWCIIYMQYQHPSLCTLIYACRRINAFLQHPVVRSLTYFFYSIIYSMQLKNLNCIANYTKLLLCTSLFKFVKRYK